MLLPPALGFSPHPPVSVYGTGTSKTIAAFLDGPSRYFATKSSLRITFLSYVRAFLPHPSDGLHRAPLPAYLYLPCPRSSAHKWCRNINLLSIDYAFQPRLRPRLPQGRSALPWIPWIFGLKDSYLHLATHSGILSSSRSAALHSTVSPRDQCSPTNHGRTHPSMIPWLRWCVSAPVIFGAGPLGQ